MRIPKFLTLIGFIFCLLIYASEVQSAVWYVNATGTSPVELHGRLPIPTCKMPFQVPCRAMGSGSPLEPINRLHPS